MERYQYRKRTITAKIMKPLIVELFSGREAVRRSEIIETCEREHLKRGGTKSGNPVVAFKSAVKDLRGLGIVEDAGHGYWHIIGGFTPDDANQPTRRARIGVSTKQLSARERNWTKHLLYAKQEGACAGCMRRIDFQDLTLDHIQPLSKGGGDEESNLQLLCTPCNSRKGART